MKRIFFLLPFLLFFISSCSKQAAEKRECERENIGYVTITNTSKNPYNILMDGVYKFELAGNTFKGDIKVSAGFHDYKAVQVSGFALYPTVKKIEFSTWICKKSSWVIP